MNKQILIFIIIVLLNCPVNSTNVETINLLMTHEHYIDFIQTLWLYSNKENNLDINLSQFTHAKRKFNDLIENEQESTTHILKDFHQIERKDSGVLNYDEFFNYFETQLLQQKQEVKKNGLIITWISSSDGESDGEDSRFVLWLRNLFGMELSDKWFWQLSGSTSSDGEGGSGSEEDTPPAADGEDGGDADDEDGGDSASESSSDGEYIAENQPWWRFWIARQMKAKKLQRDENGLIIDQSESAESKTQLNYQSIGESKKQQYGSIRQTKNQKVLQAQEPQQQILYEF